LIVRGLILVGEELEPVPGHVVVESGVIREVAETRQRKTEAVVMPGLINCHTHIGDYAFKDQGIRLSLEDLVKSPTGLKHILLSKATPRELVEGMAAAEREMIACGTTSFLDFREQGQQGVLLFRKAVRRIEGLAYGRPQGPENGLSLEVQELLNVAEGIGLDRVSAYTEEALRTVREAASGKKVAVHVSEAHWRSGEIELALDWLGADILVHLTQAKAAEIRLMANRKRKAAVCPRSNISLGLGVPPIDRLIDEGVEVGLGTDNCMLNSPSLFREMETALAIMRDKRPREVLKMATTTAAKVLGISRERGTIEKGKAADLIVLERRESMSLARDVHAAIAKRAGPENITLVIKDGRPIFDRRR